VSRRPVEDNLPIVIDFRPDQGYANRTLPSVAASVKSKPAGMVSIGSLMRVLGKPFQCRGDDHEENGIGCHEHRLNMECADHFSSEMPIR
jgi:hypothetical protein